MRLLASLPLLLLPLLAPSLNATVLIYNGGAPNFLEGSEMTQYIEGARFVLYLPAALESVTFWVEQANTNDANYNGSIAWFIYEDQSGSPGTLLDSGTDTPTPTLTGRTQFGAHEYVVNLDLGVVNLDSGTYWLGLHNGPLSDQTFGNFYFEGTDSPAPDAAIGQAQDAPYTGGFFGVAYHPAFEIEGQLPEPSPAVLVLAGMAALLIRRNARCA
jgi:hypothetical protein